MICASVHMNTIWESFENYSIAPVASVVRVAEIFNSDRKGQNDHKDTKFLEGHFVCNFIFKSWAEALKMRCTANIWFSKWEMKYWCQEKVSWIKHIHTCPCGRQKKLGKNSWLQYFHLISKVLATRKCPCGKQMILGNNSWLNHFYHVSSRSKCLFHTDKVKLDWRTISILEASNWLRSTVPCFCYSFIPEFTCHQKALQISL